MISCENYDYIEIACTYQYPLRLTMKSGKVINCIAKDTSLNEDRSECIIVSVDGADRLIVLNEILKIEAKVDNPHLKSISFK